MALPQGIRGRGSRPRYCTGIDGSEHLHRVNRIHLAPRDAPQWCAHASRNLGSRNPDRRSTGAPGRRC
eukprot:5423021-Prymnesium_polylepis.1